MKMRKYENPEINVTFFKAEECITISFAFGDSTGIEDYGAI